MEKIKIMKIYSLNEIETLDCNELRLDSKGAQLLQIIRDLASEVISLRDRIIELEAKNN